MEIARRKQLASLLREYPVPLPKKKSSLVKDFSNKIYLWYGKPKAGKTTIAAGLGEDEKKMLFFPTEPGHKFQEIYKWEREDGRVPQDWGDWLDACRDIAKGDHDFKMIVVDTVDNLWMWCEQYVCKKNGWDHLSDGGFGKGYTAARDEFRRPLDWLAKNNYGLIFISHEKTTQVEDGPRTFNYTDTTLPNTAKKIVHALCNYIFYFTMDAQGARSILTKGSEVLNAGDRSGKLPPAIEMDAEKMKTLLNQ